MRQIGNVAHGEFFVLGGMLAYVLTHFLVIPFAVAIPIVLVVMWIFGAFVDWALLSRMRDAPMISTALVTIGLSVFMMNTMLLVFGTEPKNIEPGRSEARRVGKECVSKCRSGCRQSN